MIPRADLELRRQQTEAFLLLSRLHQHLGRVVGELFGAEGLEDITPQQANALMILFQARAPLTARQLAEEMGLSEVTVGRFVKALESGDWVGRERDPADSRALLLRPTAKARAALPRFIGVTNALLDQAFAGLSQDETAELSRMVAVLQENLRR